MSCEKKSKNEFTCFINEVYGMYYVYVDFETAKPTQDYVCSILNVAFILFWF